MGISGSSMSSYNESSPCIFNSLTIFSWARTRSDSPVKSVISSIPGVVWSELSNHNPIAVRRRSSLSRGAASGFSSPATSVFPFCFVDFSLVASSLSFSKSFTRPPSVLNSSTLKSAIALSGVNVSFHVFSGSAYAIGASRRIVASIFENNASSSPAISNSTMRGLMPTSVSFSFPFSSAL